jgi:hypothetical protein
VRSDAVEGVVGEERVADEADECAAAQQPNIVRPPVVRETTTASTTSMVTSTTGNMSSANSDSGLRPDADTTGSTSGSHAMKRMDVPSRSPSSTRRTFEPDDVGAPGRLSVPRSASPVPARSRAPAAGLTAGPAENAHSTPSHRPTPASQTRALQP